MSKGKIITFSIIFFVVVLTALLFGAVFRLREVEVVGDTSGLDITNEQLISDSNLKFGSSIFLLDKNTATTKLEKTYPKLKIVHIKTTSVTKVQIIVRQRKELFEIKNLDKYLILDEELKVLDTTDTSKGLIEIDDSLVEIKSSTQNGDFVGKNNSNTLTNNLYLALLRTVKAENSDSFVEHNDIIDILTNIKLDVGYTLSGEYTRLIINTKYGVTIDIGKPDVDLDYKINVCFSAIASLTEEQKQTATIKFYYLQDGSAQYGIIY